MEFGLGLSCPNLISSSIQIELMLKKKHNPNLTEILKMIIQTHSNIRSDGPTPTLIINIEQITYGENHVNYYIK